MLLHEISFARELQSYTVNSFRRHFEHVALFSLLCLHLFRIMAVKQKQACTDTTDTYVVSLISMNSEMILRQHFHSLGQNQKFGTGNEGETLSKNCTNNFGQ
jgi:hypothetical protein